MKKTMIMMALLLLSSALVSAELPEQVTFGSGLEATLLYYEPVPAQPGDTVEVFIQIENNGGSESKSGTLTLLESSAISVENEGDKTLSFPKIPGRESFLGKADVRISKSANEGDNVLKVRVQERGVTTYQEFDLVINVQGTTSALSITDVSLKPKEVLPGESATLSVTVKNVGDTKVRNVDVALDLDGLSLAPTSSSDSKTINQLLGGREHTFVFDLTAYPDATARAYQIPITLAYEDETGTESSQEETVGLVVGTKPELLVYFESVDISSESNSGEVVIRFVNKGLAEIKLLEMEILENEKIQVTSESNVVYVGNIDEDDYESAEISLHLKDREAAVPIEIKYRDALNREYSETYELTARVPSTNGNGGISGWIWLLIAALVVAGIWYWRSRNSGKKRRR